MARLLGDDLGVFIDLLPLFRAGDHMKGEVVLIVGAEFVQCVDHERSRGFSP